MNNQFMERVILQKNVNISILAPNDFVKGVFSDLAILLNSALKSLNFNSFITTNLIYSEPEHSNIILAPQFIPDIDLRRLNNDTIIINMEPLEAWRFSENTFKKEAFHRIMYVATKCQVWDYNERNINYFKKSGFNHIKYLKLGYTPELSRIPVDVHKDIDILFYGDMNERRKRILDALMEKGLNVVILSNTFGNELDHFISRSKIVLNIHYHDVAIWEILRCIYLMHNNVAIVSEINSTTTIGQKEYLDGIAGVPYEQLVDKCCELLSNPQELELLRKRGLEIIQKYPQSMLIEPLLKQA